MLCFSHHLSKKKKSRCFDEETPMPTDVPMYLILSQPEN
jgi:hypothetical protein